MEQSELRELHDWIASHPEFDDSLNAAVDLCMILDGLGEDWLEDQTASRASFVTKIQAPIITDGWSPSAPGST